MKRYLVLDGLMKKWKLMKQDYALKILSKLMFKIDKWSVTYGRECKLNHWTRSTLDMSDVVCFERVRSEFCELDRMEVRWMTE